MVSGGARTDFIIGQESVKSLEHNGAGGDDAKLARTDHRSFREEHHGFGGARAARCLLVTNAPAGEADFVGTGVVNLDPFAGDEQSMGSGHAGI